MKEVKVFAPATVANVACGYDILGFAVNEPGDEVIVRFCEKPGVVIKKITGDNGELPISANENTAGVAVKSFLNYINADKGIELELSKKMPVGSGLGSSAASAVAGVVAANTLFGNPLTKEELLPFTLEAEKVACGSAHADNVAPSLYGGFVLIKSYNPLRVIKIPIPDLFCTIVHPEIIIRTEDARDILRRDIQLQDVIMQYSNVAGLIAGLYRKDYDLIKDSLHDVIIEPHRSKLIPGFFEVKKAAIRAGALGSSISGSGPSIFALSRTLEIAEEVGEPMQEAFNSINIQSQVYVSEINDNGPRIIE